MIKEGFKQCSKCQEIKPLEEFSKGRLCKDCKRKYDAEYRKAHVEEIKKHNAEYYKTHVEERKEYLKAHAEGKKEYDAEYWKTNIEDIKKRTGGYYKTNTERIKKQVAEYRKTHAEGIRKYSTEYCKTNIANLTDGYVKTRIATTYHINNPSRELIELKRNQLLYKRALKELQKTIKGGKENGSD